MISVSFPLDPYQVNLFKFFTALSYANSAINPFLYAFTNDAFKSAFADAFRCFVSQPSQHPTDRRDARRRNADARKRNADAADERVADGEAQPLDDLNHAGCQRRSSAIPLKTMTRTSITGQTTVRQAHVVIDQLPRATTAVLNNDFRSRKTCVTVHLEQHQQQQLHEHGPNEDPNTNRVHDTDDTPCLI